MTIREYFYLLSPTVLLYLVSLLITFYLSKRISFYTFVLLIGYFVR